MRSKVTQIWLSTTDGKPEAHFRRDSGGGRVYHNVSGASQVRLNNLGHNSMIRDTLYCVYSYGVDVTLLIKQGVRCVN